MAFKGVAGKKLIKPHLAFVSNIEGNHFGSDREGPV
jgi:hypothetical protein